MSANPDDLRTHPHLSKCGDEELAGYVAGYREQGLTYGDLADCYLAAIGQLKEAYLANRGLDTALKEAQAIVVQLTGGRDVQA